MSEYRFLITANYLTTLYNYMLSFADYLVQNRAVYAPIRFEEIVIIIIVMINKVKKKNNQIHVLIVQQALKFKTFRFQFLL